MKITNDGQLTSIYNRKNISFPMSKQTVDEIHKECNKPLQSRWYVAVNNQKSKFRSNRNTGDYIVRRYGNLWLWYDKPQTKTSSETLLAQKKLYNQLKKEYEQSLQASDDVDTITMADKVKAVARKKNINMISGLACSPRYDRIYSNM